MPPKKVKFTIEEAKKETQSLNYDKEENNQNDQTIPRQQQQPAPPTSNLKLNIFIFTIALLLGMLIQQGNIYLSHQQSSWNEKNIEIIAPTNNPEPQIDLNQLFKEMSDNLKRELLENLKNIREEKSVEVPEIKETAKPVENKETIEIKETAKPVENKETIEIKETAKPVENKETIEMKETAKPVENKENEDVIINEVIENVVEHVEEKKTVIDVKMQEDENIGLKFGKSDEPIILDSSNLKFKLESKEVEKEEAEKERREREDRLRRDTENEMRRKKKIDEERERKRRMELEEKERRVKEDNEKNLKKEEVKTSKTTQPESQSSNQVPDEVKNFKSNKISMIKPKKMWIPIPNSNGGHRRVPALEVKAGKEHGSSVKMWLYEEFLTKEECENLIKAHESHLVELLKQKPIICFDSVSTLRKNLIELKRDQVAERVSPLDFLDGTMCINQTFSRQLEKWGLKWSYSTAFYPGESRFSKIFGKLIEDATMLNETHGGKFQITSYPHGVGYKDHTDCLLDSDEQRDRYATFLVYLNDLGGDGGGETIFPELGIDVKPRQGRALTWNNMNYETGKCESKSSHNAAQVKHVTKKKYVIQRWYYLKNFYALGKRMRDTPVPERPEYTPKVSCDNYDHGSCRMYDEWNPDHLIEYRRNKQNLI